MTERNAEARRDREARELARRGFSLNAIARQVGGSWPTVSRALGRTGTKRR
jgi:hypothetical protein